MRKEKQILLDELKEKITGSKAMIITNYTKLAPQVSWDLANRLGKSSFFEVVKKRVFIKAAKEAGFVLDPENLGGHIGVVFIGEDIASATKLVYDFNKDKGALLRIVGGCFEGALCSTSDFDVIAKLPSQNVLRSEFLATLEAPMAGVVGVMESLLSGVAYCLMNKSQNEK